MVVIDVLIDECGVLLLLLLLKMLFIRFFLIYFIDDKFEFEVFGSDQFVLVDFWVEWCGLCCLLISIIEELVSEFGELVKVGKLNVDENFEIVVKYQIIYFIGFGFQGW